MWRRWRAASAVLVVSALPLSAATANPAPGALFVGAPAGFGSDRVHLRVDANGTAMRLVGSFAWSYGCRVIANYGVADPRTLAHFHGGGIAMFPAPAVLIHGNRFYGGTELRRRGHRYGRFTLSGIFTGARSAKASFTMTDKPRCGRFTERFRLRAA